MTFLERLEAARLDGVWLEITKTGHNPWWAHWKPASGYAVKAQWVGGQTLIHVGPTLEEAVALAFDDAERRKNSVAQVVEGEK